MKFLLVLLFAVVAVLASPVSEFIPEDTNPLFVPANDVRFLLFTRFNPTVGQELRFNDMTTVQASNWVATRPTRFVTHGFNKYMCEIMFDMKFSKSI